MIRRAIPLAAALLLALSGAARAQMGPTPFPASPTGGGGAEEPKHEGVAEAAPKTPGLLPTTPTLPPPKSHRKRLQVLEVDGYLRLRTDWFRNFNLGFIDDPAKGGAPFARPLGCSSTTTATPCGQSLSDANMRLRLEPTINVDETTAVHAQIDLLDNQILGATPEGTYYDGTPTPGNIPFGAFSNSAAVPVAGVNGHANSIAVKRAWAEVGTPLGVLEFGRMPDQWGLGIMHNGGGADPLTGTYDLDADYGDSVDRVAFSALVPGAKLKARVSVDWPASGIDSSMTTSGLGRQSGQALDLDDTDDVAQYSVAVSRMDSPTEFKDAIDRGEAALNWGAYVTQRTQEWDYGQKTPYTLGTSPDPNQLVNRNYKAYVFDPWIKFGLGSWRLEGEAVGVIGSVGTIADLCANRVDPCNQGPIDIYQFGGVARATYIADEGRFRVGMESGYASGDQYDGQNYVGGKLQTVAGETNIAHANLLPSPGDGNMTQFIFDRDYKVDLILFRHLLGAVTNALYFKPKLEYDLSKSFSMRIWNVTSFAARPVATPGNGAMYGLEFDGELGYVSPTFNAGVAMGALFPLGAMSHPADSSAVQNGPGFKYDASNQGDGSSAYVIQLRMAVRF